MIELDIPESCERLAWRIILLQCDNCLLPLRLTLVPSEHLVKFTCGVKRCAKNNFSNGKHRLSHLFNCCCLTTRVIASPESKLTFNSYASYRLSQWVVF